MTKKAKMKTTAKHDGCVCVHCEGGAAGKCQIEVGESTGAKKLGLQRWWWNIHLDCVDGPSIAGGNSFYKSKRSAVRNGRVWAERFGLTVTDVYDYGKEPSEP